MSPADYIRAIEHHVCQKNDGHLIRIVGPAFEVVARWERDGVPLKVALRGIDRYFERYYRNGPKRRPVRVEFCEADVLEVYDEWRRAVGALAGAAGKAEGEVPAGPSGPAAAERHGPSLPAHLERVLIKLSNARATGRLGDETDALIDRVSAELDAARTHARGLRGDARRALLDRLEQLDRELVLIALAQLPEDERTSMTREAEDELAAFRERLAPDAFGLAVSRMRERLLRERLGLPVIALV